MVTVRKFEELEIWKLSREFNQSMFLHFSGLKYFYFRDQILRASLSIMNNIAEGFERSSDREFRNFLNIAKGSAGEVRSMLYLALDQKMINKPVFDQNYNSVTAISSGIGALIKYLK